MPQAENCRCKYTVVVNMAGYLPNNEPECYRTKRAAQSSAKWHADQYREEGYRTPLGVWYPYADVHGNMRDGYTVYRRDTDYGIPTYIRVHDTCPDDASHYCQCDECQ